MEGYIKLHRQITEWEWYHDSNTFRVFIHLLLNANHTDGKWKGIEIKRGQRFTSIASLSKELCLSQKAIRGAIEKLISCKNVACKGANNGTMITICNYDIYQSKLETEGQTEWQTKGEQRANNGANEGRQTRIRKNVNNVKNENNVKNGWMSIPTLSEVISYFDEKGYSELSAKKAFEYYDAANWHDSNNKPVINWKQKMRGVWFKDENKKPAPTLPQQERQGWFEVYKPQK